MMYIRISIKLAWIGVVIISSCTNPRQGSDSAQTENDLSEIISPESNIIKLAGGFQFTEGPAWNQVDDYLLFSDIPANTIYQWTREDSISVFEKPSGNTNGLAFDDQQRLYQCEHGNRQLVRIVADTVQVLASRYNGKRLNSPNDLVLANNGAVYFTDPPWGLPENQNDPAKELDFNGVYKYHEDSLILLIDSLTWPNGIALSPDEKFLYVGSYQQEAPRWFRYQLNEKGIPVSGALFFDASEFGDNHPDGMAVDEKGNLYCTGPQGVLVLSADGKLMGIIKPEELPANCAIGGPDNKTLFMTARKGLYSVELKNAGL